MSCLLTCKCEDSVKEIELAHTPDKNDSPLDAVPSASTCLSEEAMPLLSKDTDMIVFEGNAAYYELLYVIGNGLQRSTTISLARHLPSGRHVAIRRTNLDDCKDDVSYMQQEILVTRQLRHKNLLPYLNSFVCDSEIWIVTPLMPFGSAQDLMKSAYPDGLPEIAIAFIMRDILSALEYIHKHGFVHRSLRSSHILLSQNGTAILTGMRYFCNVMQNGRWQPSVHTYPPDTIANLKWLSPEMLEQNLMGYSSKSDIYSLGIAACQLANGFEPYADVPPTQMLLDKIRGYIAHPLDGTNVCPDGHGLSTDALVLSCERSRSDMTKYKERLFSESFHNFVEVCQQRDPLERPSAAMLQHHSFLKQCRKSTVTMMDILSSVTPLNERDSLPKDSRNMDQAMEKMESLAVGDDWIF